eukprot:399262-Amphidinium_carterae.1
MTNFVAPWQARALSCNCSLLCRLHVGSDAVKGRWQPSYWPWLPRSPTMALERDYEVFAGLGEGAFGKVYKAAAPASDSPNPLHSSFKK